MNIGNIGISRRGFLVATSAVVVGGIASGGSALGQATLQPAPAVFKLPPLGYAYDAVEPNIDARTMEIHHTKHHGAFVTNLNRLAVANPMLSTLTAQAILADNCAAVPEAARTPVRNNLGGHLNHTLYWETLNPAGKSGAEPVGALAEQIESDLGGWEKAKTDLAASSMGRFGSGWGWLVLKDGKLSILSTANQDSPWMAGQVPLLGIDVWEHAYYLKYQNRRADYIAAFWNAVNWQAVGGKFEKLGK